MALTQVRTKQLIKVSDHFDAQGFRGVNAADALNPTDWVTLQQVQSLMAGNNTKPAVRLATTGAETYTITGTGAGGSPQSVTTIAGTTIDGVAAAIGDRITVKNAPAASGAGTLNVDTNSLANGIYTVTGNATNLTLARATDMDSWGEVPAAYTWVKEGTINADTGWLVISNDGTGLVLGQTGAGVQWTLYASAGSLIAGNGLVKVGNGIDIVGSAGRIVVNADSIDLATVSQTNSAGTDGISFVQSHSVDSFGRITGTVTASVRLATAAQTGIASFNTASFVVTAGDVTIKAGGVSNAQLANSSLTVTPGTGISGGGSVSLGGTITITNTGVLSITGTANQIIASAATGAVTLSLPQNIHTGALPTFANLILAGGTATYGFSLTQTWNGASTGYNAIQVSITDTASLTTSNLIDLQVGGVSRFQVRKDGTITAGTWGGSAIGGIYGGTGQSAYAQGDILWASATNTLARLPISATIGNQLMVTATGTLGYGATNLAGGAGYISGILPVANGGTNTGTAPTAGQFLVATSATAYAPRTLTNGTGVTITSDATTTTISISSAVLQAANFVPYEVPTGTVNGVNTDFVLANTPINGAGSVSTLNVFVSGVRMQPNSNDYAMLNATTIRFQAGAIPQTGDVVSVFYFK